MGAVKSVAQNSCHTIHIDCTYWLYYHTIQYQYPTSWSRVELKTVAGAVYGGDWICGGEHNTHEEVSLITHWTSRHAPFTPPIALDTIRLGYSMLDITTLHYSTSVHHVSHHVCYKYYSEYSQYGWHCSYCWALKTAFIPHSSFSVVFSQSWLHWPLCFHVTVLTAPETPAVTLCHRPALKVLFAVLKCHLYVFLLEWCLATVVPFGSHLGPWGPFVQTACSAERRVCRWMTMNKLDLTWLDEGPQPSYALVKTEGLTLTCLHHQTPRLGHFLRGGVQRAGVIPCVATGQSAEVEDGTSDLW